MDVRSWVAGGVRYRVQPVGECRDAAEGVGRRCSTPYR